MDSDNEIITKLRIELVRLNTIIIEHEKALKLAHQNIIAYMGLAVAITAAVVHWIK